MEHRHITLIWFVRTLVCAMIDNLFRAQKIHNNLLLKSYKTQTQSETGCIVSKSRY